MERGARDQLLMVSKLEKSVYGKYRLRARALENLVHPTERYLFPLLKA